VNRPTVPVPAPTAGETGHAKPGSLACAGCCQTRHDSYRRLPRKLDRKFRIARDSTGALNRAPETSVNAVRLGRIPVRVIAPKALRRDVPGVISAIDFEEIYAQLTEEGFLKRAVGKGTFVAWAVSRLSAPAHGKETMPRSSAPSRRGHSVAAIAACREPAVPRPFNAGIADTSEFPWKIWQRLHARASRATAWTLPIRAACRICV
jgi:hypothetical protein